MSCASRRLLLKAAFVGHLHFYFFCSFFIFYFFRVSCSSRTSGMWRTSSSCCWSTTSFPSSRYAVTSIHAKRLVWARYRLCYIKRGASYADCSVFCRTDCPCVVVVVVVASGFAFHRGGRIDLLVYGTVPRMKVLHTSYIVCCRRLPFAALCCGLVWMTSAYPFVAVSRSPVFVSPPSRVASSALGTLLVIVVLLYFVLSPPAPCFRCCSRTAPRCSTAHASRVRRARKTSRPSRQARKLGLCIGNDVNICYIGYSTLAPIWGPMYVLYTKYFTMSSVNRSIFQGVP